MTNSKTEMEQPPDVSAGRSHFWRSYGISQGLRGTVRCLYLDRDGYLWVGTGGSGLYRFDGSDFVPFTMAQGLPSNCIEAISQDEEGVLWLATLNGLSRYDGQKFTNYGVAEGLPHRFLWSLCQDDAGMLWCTTRAGVARFDRQSRFEVFTERDGLGSPRVGAVARAADGTLWFGTREGLTRFDGSHFRTFSVSDGLINNDVGAVLVDQTGKVWCGSRTGLACFDGRTFSAYSRDTGVPEFVTCLFEDHAGRIWCGSYGDGVCCIDQGKPQVYTANDGLAGNRVRSMREDREHRMYFGCMEAGLSCLDEHTFVCLSPLAATRGVSRTQRGRLRFSHQTQLVGLDSPSRSHDFGSTVMHDVEDGSGRCWVATPAGVTRFASEDALFRGEGQAAFAEHEQPEGEVTSLFLASDGGLYLSTALSTEVWRIDGPCVQRIGTPHRGCYILGEDRRGRLCIAGRRDMGLSSFDNGVFVPRIPGKTIEDRPEFESIRGFVEEDDGTLWLATVHGVYECGPLQRELGDPKPGTEGVHCSCIALDARGHVWVGSPGAGIFRFSRRHVQVLTQEDGLPSNVVTGLLAETGGSMIVATMCGIVRYHPAAAQAPWIKVSEVFADRAFAYPSAVELTVQAASHVTINLHGAALSSRQVSYSYTLGGFDTQWHVTWEPQVRYEQLPVGRYTFEAVAANRDLVPSPQPATVTLRVVKDPAEERFAAYETRIGQLSKELALRRRLSMHKTALVALAKTKIVETGALLDSLREAAHTCAAALDAARITFWQFNDDKSALSGTVLFPATAPEDVQAGPSILAEQAPAFFAGIESSRAIEAGSGASDDITRELERGYLAPHGIKALLGVPVRVGDRTVGVVCYERMTDAGEWGIDSEYFASSATDVIAMLIARYEHGQTSLALRRQEEETRRFNRQLTALQRLSARLSRAESLDALCRGSVVLGREYLGFDRLGLWLFEQDGETVRGTYGTDEQGNIRDERGIAFGDWKNNAPEAFSRNVPCLHTPERDIYWDGNWVGRCAYSSAPVWDGERILGVLCMDNLLTHHPVSDQDNQLLVLYADVLAHYISRSSVEDERDTLEKSLRQAQKMEAIGQLAGGIAHDFNNLLQATMGYTDLAMKASPAGSRGLSLLGEAQKASERAAVLVKQLLTFSRREEIRLKPVDLPELLADVLKMLRRIIGEHIELRTSLSPGLKFIYADPVQIDQVLMNLCVNARDAMPQGGSISIEAKNFVVDAGFVQHHPWAKTGEYVCLSISDTGKGMPPEVVERIFEPFFTTKELGKGTGMGLATVYAIVKQHSGLIHVYSEPGQGSTFRVYIPVAEMSLELQPRGEIEEAKGGSETLLVAEDDEFVRGLTVCVLEEAGYNVLVACDGEEAVRIFARESGRVALCLLDVIMPKKTGRTAFEEMCVIRPGTPVLFVTGYGYQALHSTALPPEEHEVLQKPYEPRMLLRKIREILDRNRA